MLTQRTKQAWDSLVQVAASFDHTASEYLSAALHQAHERITELEQRLAAVEQATPPNSQKEAS